MNYGGFNLCFYLEVSCQRSFLRRTLHLKGYASMAALTAATICWASERLAVSCSEVEEIDTLGNHLTRNSPAREFTASTVAPRDRVAQTITLHPIFTKWSRLLKRRLFGSPWLSMPTFTSSIVMTTVMSTPICSSSITAVGYSFLSRE